jgi:hypothetical protein
MTPKGHKSIYVVYCRPPVDDLPDDWEWREYGSYELWGLRAPIRQLLSEGHPKVSVLVERDEEVE